MCVCGHRNLIHLCDYPASEVDKGKTVCVYDQWQQALKPIAKKARQSFSHAHTEERKVLVQRSLALNQVQIESTRLIIARLDQLIGRAEETLASQSLRRQMLRHYQRLRTHYVTRLDQLTQFALTSPHLNEQ